MFIINHLNKKEKYMSDLNRIQKEIVAFLANNGLSSLGRIAKELHLSYTSALKNILSLKKDGVVANDVHPPLYNLTEK
jgi:DNA-binding Lrp family transcriptional regulator